MPVYNGEKYLKEAIESILSQSYSNFEFIIVNDGSTDNTESIIQSFSDKRIRLVHNKINLGQAKSQNIGINLARGEYIIRMDADDISLPDRLQKQVEFMDAFPEIGISGTSVRLLVDKIKKKTLWQFPTNPDKIKSLHLFKTSMCHPTIIMRKDLLLKNNLFYNPLFETAEDYELFVRASNFFPISNLNKALLLYRLHPGQVSSRGFLKQTGLTRQIRFGLLKNLIFSPSKEELYIHNLISESQRFNTRKEVLSAQAWLERLENANEEKIIFKRSALSENLAELWLKVCKYSSHLGLWTFSTYYNSKYSQSNQIDMMQKAKLLFMCAGKLSPLSWEELMNRKELTR